MSEPAFETTLRLVQAAQGGDQRALNDLFERYLPRTRRIVACRMGWRLRQLEEHEDLVQATLLRVFQGLDRFEAQSEGSFRHWVAHLVECTIRNAARDAKRAKRGGGRVRRWSELADESLSRLTFAGDDPSPSAVVQARELEERLEDALQKLPERYRELIVLRSLCGMSYGEIAATVGAEKEGTVRQIYSRAVQKLKDLLEA
jgi:RNA polymerase sigma-70 factor (ECF subfamily)